MGIKKLFSISVLFFVFFMTSVYAADVVYKEGSWATETLFAASMLAYDSVPMEDFHAYQPREESFIRYCSRSDEECRPLWRVFLNDLGISGTLGWYASCLDHGACERGVCKEGLTCDTDACQVCGDGEFLYTDEDSCDHYDTRQYRTGYKCEVYSSTGGHSIVFWCMCNGHKIGGNDWCDNNNGETYNTRWTYTTESISGEADCGGLDCGALLESHGFTYEEGCDCCYESFRTDYKQYYKPSLSNEDIAMLYNHTKCWIEGSELKYSGDEFSKFYRIEGTPSTYNGHISCLIDYDNWSEQARDSLGRVADQFQPGGKLYFDFTGQMNTEPEEPSNETNMTDPVEPEKPVEPDVGMINVSTIASAARGTISVMKSENMLAAKLTDEEAGGKTMELTECVFDMLSEPINPSDGIDFQDIFGEYIIKEYLDDSLSISFNEHGYETAVADYYNPALDDETQAINNHDFIQIPKTDFTKDIITYFDYNDLLSVYGREWVQKTISEGNLLKFKMKVTLLVSKAVRFLIIGEIGASASAINWFKIGNSYGSDIEGCFWENYAQATINQVLSVNMQSMLESALSRAQEIKEIIAYLNSNPDQPSVKVIPAPKGFTVQNTFSRPILVDAFFDMNLTVRQYCGQTPIDSNFSVSNMKTTPFAGLISRTYSDNPQMLDPGKAHTLNVYYYPEMKEELNKINLAEYCNFNCYGTNAGKYAKLQGSGDAYLLYGENKAIAAKKFSLTDEYKKYTCSAPAVPSGGGGGGGGSSGGSSSAVIAGPQPSKLAGSVAAPKPAAPAPAISTGMLNMGMSSSSKLSSNSGASQKSSQPKSEITAQPKKEDPKNAEISVPNAADKPKESQKPAPIQNIVIQTVKTISSILLAPIMPILSFFRIF